MSESWGRANESLIRVFLMYCQKLLDSYDEIRHLQAKISTFGLSSPRIKSLEEAKYQSSARSQSETELLQLIEKRDALRNEYQYMDWFCYQIQLGLMKLDPEDLELLYLRFERGYTLREIAIFDYSNKNSVMNKLDTIYSKLDKQFN